MTWQYYMPEFAQNLAHELKDKDELSDDDIRRLIESYNTPEWKTVRNDVWTKALPLLLPAVREPHFAKETVLGNVISDMDKFFCEYVVDGNPPNLHTFVKVISEKIWSSGSTYRRRNLYPVSKRLKDPDRLKRSFRHHYGCGVDDPEHGPDRPVYDSSDETYSHLEKLDYRRQAVVLVEKLGWDRHKVANKFDVHVSTVDRWRNKYDVEQIVSTFSKCVA